MSRQWQCPEVRLALDSFRGRELADGDRTAVEWHLRGCADCMAALSDAQALGGLLRLRVDLLAEEGLPGDFTDRVMAALPPAMPSRQSFFAGLWRGHRPLVLGGLGLAALCAAVVLPLVLRQGRGGQLAAEAAENEAHIHRLEVQSPNSHPVVFQNEEGRTVIWVVSDENEVEPVKEDRKR